MSSDSCDENSDEHEFNKTWKITASHSLLQPFARSETAKRYQDASDQFEKEKLIAWKNNAWKVLNYYIDYDVFVMIASYCARDVAYYYIINTANDDYDGCDFLGNILNSTIPQCLIGKLRFADVVEVPGHRGSGVYIVNYVDLIDGTGSLLQVGQNGSGQIDIPVSITNELCDPIELYRFCAPTQGLYYKNFIDFAANLYDKYKNLIYRGMWDEMNRLYKDSF
eukprot:40683_1